MAGTSELLQPSLEQNWKETKTYDINRFFTVAFFGGTIPLMILGTRNAKWLNVSKKKISLLMIMGIILSIVEIGSFALFVSGAIKIDSQLFKFLLRAGAILLFFAYKKVLNKPFQQHLMNNGTITKIFKPAILWMLVAGIIEFAVLVVVGGFLPS